MKNLFLAGLLLFSSFIIAQTNGGLPRWGQGPPQNDNTGRILTYAVKGVITTTATTVLYQVPNAYETIYTIATLTAAATDSIGVINLQGIYTAYAGDKVTLIYTADASGRTITFAGAYVHYVSSTLAVPASKKASITFVYDGYAWVELYRSIMNN